MTELLIASRRCAECLTSRGRIVSGERAAELIRNCRDNQNHFQCHKGSIAGQMVHCRGVHDLMLRLGRGSQAWQMATRLGIPIREIDPEKLERE